MKKKLIIPTLIVLITIGVGYALLQISNLRDFQFFGEIISRVNTTEKVVALTFDDGPTLNTDNVLNILAAYNVKTTFFVIGKQMEQYPELAQKIVDQGNDLGNHSYSHQRLILVSPSFVEDEITKTDEFIRKTGFNGEITFRPPNGKKFLVLPWYLSQHNVKTITWDVEPDTFYSGNKEQIVQYTIDNVKPGSIIVMHPFCDVDCLADREALPIIIKGLIDKGYKFVTVNELLQYREIK